MLKASWNACVYAGNGWKCLLRLVRGMLHCLWALQWAWSRTMNTIKPCDITVLIAWHIFTDKHQNISISWDLCVLFLNFVPCYVALSIPDSRSPWKPQKLKNIFESLNTRAGNERMTTCLITELCLIIVTSSFVTLHTAVHRFMWNVVLLVFLFDISHDMGWGGHFGFCTQGHPKKFTQVWE